jgi:hypothetical protein
MILPENSYDRRRAAALLAYNLASDQTATLLLELERRAAQTAASASATPPANAPATTPAPSVSPATHAVTTAAAAETLEMSRICHHSSALWPLTAGLVSPVAIPPLPADTAFNFSALYGDVANVRGVGVGAVMRVRCDANGVLATWLGNVVERNARGLLVGTGFNVGRGSLDGVALSAGFNLHLGHVRGVSIAPLSVASKSLEGAQLSFANIATSTISGAQLGLINIGGATSGVQLGLLNIGTSVRGAQLGLINVAGPVRGVQLGLFNVAKEVDAAIGSFFSISWAYPVRGFAWTTTTTPLQLGVMFEGKRMYSAITFGRLITETLSNGKFILGAELGAHLLRNPKRGALLDLALGFDSSVGVGGGRVADLSRLGMRFGYRIEPRFAPYAYGGGVLIDTQPSAPLPDFRLRPEFGGGVLF